MALISSSWKFDGVLLLTGLLTLLYFFTKRTYSYWERRGFKTLPGFNYYFGHYHGVFKQKAQIGDWFKQLYNSTKEPFVGIYGIYRPMLLVRDPELVRAVLIKDFSSFVDRGFHSDPENDPLTGNLFGLTGARWKNLRGKLSPTFTSGKLKAMFSTLNDCGLKLQNHLHKLADKGEMLDVREVSAAHATNVIASVAFGIEIDAIKDPNNEFRVCGRKIFAATFWNICRGLISFVQPKLMEIFHIKSVDSDVEDFIMTVVKDNLEHREKNNVVRKDFFQLMIQLRNSGSVQLDDEWETVVKSDEGQKNLTLNEMAAQAFVFFGAGFETSSTTLSFLLYELTKNREILERVHEEIDRVLDEHDGKITYDSVSKMSYLENCIDETLRKYPVLPILNRISMNDYQIPGTKQIIEKGTGIIIPVLGLQKDPQYYPEPDRFNPDRFSNEEISANKPIYLPFGDGPRNCIGMRMGKMQTKVGLVLMLQKHTFELDDTRELEFDVKAFLLSPRDGIHLRVLKR